MSQKERLVIHHDDADGFTAAWAVWKIHGDNAEYLPVQYGDAPPDVTNRKIFILDFSYKRDILLDMAEKAKSIIVLDHHETAQKELKDLDFCIFDMNKSGARLAWERFHYRIKIPSLTEYVEDHDLWRFKLPNSKEINANIFSYNYTFENLEMLNNILEDPSRKITFIREGQAILRSYNQQINKIKDNVAQLIKLPEHFGPYKGTEVLVANANYCFASELGSLLAEESPSKIAIIWSKTKNIFKYSIRSKGPDVSKIAKQIHGGGGHPGASGWQTRELIL
jgi:oligoribonuclease NrnB/cAMP/cGMP phosphodiesterase (DHH superfamily)